MVISNMMAFIINFINIKYKFKYFIHVQYTSIINELVTT